MSDVFDFEAHCARRAARAARRADGRASSGARLQRRTTLRRRNPERARWRFDEAYGEGGARGHAVRLLPCVVAGRLDPCSRQIEAAHVTSRARGGDDANLVPLCSCHHRRQHSLGLPEFERRYRVDLAFEAQRIATALDAAGVPASPSRAAILFKPAPDNARKRPDEEGST